MAGVPCAHDRNVVSVESHNVKHVCGCAQSVSPGVSPLPPASRNRVTVRAKPPYSTLGPDAACYCRPSWLPGAGEAGHRVRGGLWEVHRAARRMACAYRLKPWIALSGDQGLNAACHAQAFLAAGRAGEAVGLPVRGGLWEVDLAARRVACAYWPEPAHRVARGTWFIEKGADWVPLKVGPALAGHIGGGSVPWHGLCEGFHLGLSSAVHVCCA